MKGRLKNFALWETVVHAMYPVAHFGKCSRSPRYFVHTEYVCTVYSKYCWRNLSVLSDHSMCLCNMLNREKQTSKLQQNPTRKKKKPKPGYLEGLQCEIICISLLFHLAKQRKSLQSPFVCLPFQCANAHHSLFFLQK